MVSNATSPAISDLRRCLEETSEELEKARADRARYRELYLEMLERCRRLEQGLLGQKAEKWQADDSQLSLQILAELLGNADDDERPDSEEADETGEAPNCGTKRRSKRNGRQCPPEHLPRVDIVVTPPEVEREGLDAFDRIGEDVSEVVERRPSSMVVVRTVRPKYVRRNRDVSGDDGGTELTGQHDAEEATERLGGSAGDSCPPEDQAVLQQRVVLQSPPLDLPISRGLAGPGLLADTIVRRWQDHLPLNRLEGIYAREGYSVAKTTLCGWHLQLAELVAPLLDAMWADARGQPYLCVDATGVLVLAKEKCRRGHFWVAVAPQRHVLFAYSRRHTGAAVDKLLKDFEGYLVADAHSVYDHLFVDGTVTEVACWAHARRYFFKALGSEPERAKRALAMIGALFRIERRLDKTSRRKKEAERRKCSKPIVDRFFAWCDAESARALEDTPLEKALNYAMNQRKALERFLADGRLPLHNNTSERELRRQAIGRKNWLFVGSDDGADANASFVSLLASCQMHELEPWAYLRDLLCLLPEWPQTRVLELAPACWKETVRRPEVVAQLEANPYRTVILAEAQ